MKVRAKLAGLLWREAAGKISQKMREPMDFRPHSYEQGYIIPYNIYEMSFSDTKPKFMKGDIISYDQLKGIFKEEWVDKYASKWMLKESKLEIEPVSEQAVILKTIDKIADEHQ